MNIDFTKPPSGAIGGKPDTKIPEGHGGNNEAINKAVDVMKQASIQNRPNPTNGGNIGFKSNPAGEMAKKIDINIKGSDGFKSNVAGKLSPRNMKTLSEAKAEKDAEAAKKIKDEVDARQGMERAESRRAAKLANKKFQQELPEMLFKALGDIEDLKKKLSAPEDEGVAGNEFEHKFTEILPYLKIKWNKIRFGYKKSANVITIYAGSVKLYGVGQYDVAQSNVTLSGAIEYVYVQLPLGGGTATIQHSVTEPSCTDPVYWNFVLFVFTSTGTASYKLTWCKSLGDIIIGSTLAG